MDIHPYTWDIHPYTPTIGPDVWREIAYYLRPPQPIRPYSAPRPHNRMLSAFGRLVSGYRMDIVADNVRAVKALRATTSIAARTLSLQYIASIGGKIVARPDMRVWDLRAWVATDQTMRLLADCAVDTRLPAVMITKNRDLFLRNPMLMYDYAAVKAIIASASRPEVKAIIASRAVSRLDPFDQIHPREPIIWVRPVAHRGPRHIILLYDEPHSPCWYWVCPHVRVYEYTAPYIRRLPKPMVMTPDLLPLVRSVLGD